MELFLLLAGFAFVVFGAVLRRTKSHGARASRGVRMIKVRDRTIVRSMLVDHADAFSDRPVWPFPVKVPKVEPADIKHSINTVPHGPLWRALRCNLTAGIFHPSRLDLLGPLQREAIDGLVESLALCCHSRERRDDAVVVLRDSLHTAVLTLIMRMCFGDVGADARDVRAVQQVEKDFLEGMVYSRKLARSRMARLLHWRTWRSFLAVRSRMTKLLHRLIAESRRQWSLSCSDNVSGAGAGGRVIRPYVDSLLDLQVPSYDDESVRRALDDDEIVVLVWEFLGAGTETVVSCVEWALAHLVSQPEVQEKLCRDLNSGGRLDVAVGTPYLRAVILETLRLHPPVPVIQRDVAVGGVDGAAAAVIGVHVPPQEDGSSAAVRFNIFLGAIGRDSKAWKDPDEFRPERFLAGGEGEAVGPMPGPKEIRMMPFGVGMRHCPGMGIGMVHIRILLAALVRAFQWGVPATRGGAPVDLTEGDGFFKYMKTPLVARITPRT